MPKKAPGKVPKEPQKAGPKSGVPAKPQRAPVSSKAPEGPAGKARRLARTVGEDKAQRMMAPEGKNTQRAAKSLPPEPDSHEKEAQQIGARVAAGQRVAPETISPIAGQAPAGAQRACGQEAAPVQKCGDDMKAQKADAPAAGGMKDPPCPQKAAAVSAPAVDTASPAEVADRAIRGKGAGEPLDSGTRSVLESRMGVNLGHVRIHQDQRARQDAAALQARAFTYGNDIWLGPGESQTDIALMAHEATHVVQQGGGMRGGRIQRSDGAPPPAAAGTDTWDFESPEGKIKKDERLSIPVLKVPEWKSKFVKTPLTLKKKEEDAKRCTRQREIWDEAAGAGVLGTALDGKLKNEKAPRMQKDGKPIYYLGSDTEKNFYVLGTPEAISKRALRPFWDKKGKSHPFHVDHQLEYQLTPEGEDADVITNMWLLDAEANEKSGQNIKTEKDGRIRELLEAATIGQTKGKGKGKKAAPEPAAGAEPAKNVPIFPETPDLKKVRAKYAITFEKVKPGLPPAKIGADDTYTLKEIKDDAAQLAKLKVLTPTQISRRGLAGTPSKLVIYTRAEGGRMQVIEDWPEGGNSKKANLYYGRRAYHVTSVDYDKDSKTGMLHGMAYEKSELLHPEPLPLPIHPMEAADYGGYIPSSEVNKVIKNALKAKLLSPIEMGPVELTEDGFFGKGQVLPTIPLFRDIGIDLVLAGDDIYLSKTFTAGDFKFPGPIQVTAATLELYGGTTGLGAKGDVFFEISRLGKGSLHAAADMKSGFAISGDFDFDSELFEPASIHIEYAKDTFKGSGKIGIKEGKVRGISSALLEVSFENDKIDAVGTVTPSIPGVEQGNLEFHYNPETGMTIAGRLDLRKDIPGLAGGFVSAELHKGNDGKWKVKAAGEANPAIPGLSTRLTVQYDDGAFDAQGAAAYAKGMLKGSVNIGATNRPIGPDGKPAGDPGEKADAVTIYGGGMVGLQLAPWLQASAGIQLLPNGEVKVVGQIGLPGAVELFKGKRYDKNIFKIGIDIPIIGFTVAGQRIGIFATVGGGLDLTAGIGPGMLQNLDFCVEYNPSHEDQTHITGCAKLHIPADAGLRLYVKGGVGAGIPVVSAEAGLEVGGSIGLAGAAAAEVAVDWTPTQGLQIEALGSIYVQPKFVFDVSAYVLVELDLWLVTKTLYNKKWKLAGMDYGSDMKFGLKFPITYREGQPFDISMSDVQFELPTVDPSSILGGIIDKVVS